MIIQKVNNWIFNLLIKIEISIIISSKTQLLKRSRDVFSLDFIEKNDIIIKKKNYDN